MGYNHCIVGVQVPPDRSLQRFCAGLCQSGTGAALQMRLYLSANLFKFFLSYRHNNGSTTNLNNPSIVIERISGSPIPKNGCPSLALGRDALLHICRVTAGFGELVSLLSIQIAALDLPDDFQHIGYRHRRELDQ